MYSWATPEKCTAFFHVRHDALYTFALLLFVAHSQQSLKRRVDVQSTNELFPRHSTGVYGCGKGGYAMDTLH